MKKIDNMTVTQIKEYVVTRQKEEYPNLIPMLKEDHRAAVKKIGQNLEKKTAARDQEVQRIEKMKSIESGYYDQGILNIGGIDEVGRGPLAGPVVTCVIILKPDSSRLYVNDSKKVAKKNRETLCEQLLEDAVDYAIGQVDCDVIDNLNILNATKKAMTDSLAKLSIKPDLLLIDALHIDTDIPQKAIVHGDATSYAIAAASIVAKVYRDNLMQIYHEEYPEYGFDHNMGYGTAEHIKALKKYGPTPIHRKSFIQNLGLK
ncbi:ribonuclease HII [Acetobacterium wieringae]|jgi:ribonuclease HII|uniref:Ribonuclease HII n=1 Tax=Acetobacterium wieringae TaxID=52694 RepID=A0ABY6HA42_9FIRM|nr:MULTISPECIES: ribonuclease HII [Acetobacterium]UYO61347.1 ribonuclease HII [Acetobacterium wieringae]VUZ28759.1 Ribonuclease HII [Acetobacterium wieringae]